MTKCKKHPKYLAIRKPTADCQPCRDMWDAKNKQVSYAQDPGEAEMVLGIMGPYAPCQCFRCQED